MPKENNECWGARRIEIDVIIDGCAMRRLRFLSRMFQMPSLIVCSFGFPWKKRTFASQWIIAFAWNRVGFVLVLFLWRLVFHLLSSFALRLVCVPSSEFFCIFFSPNHYFPSRFYQNGLPFSRQRRDRLPIVNNIRRNRGALSHPVPQQTSPSH